jgi:hypothetical protein
MKLKSRVEEKKANLNEMNNDIQALKKLVIRNRATGPSKFMEFPFMIIKPTSQTSFATQTDLKALSIKSPGIMKITSDVKALGLMDVNFDALKPRSPAFQFIQRK